MTFLKYKIPLETANTTTRASGKGLGECIVAVLEIISKAIPGFSLMFEKAAKVAAMGRNASFEEVGNTCLYLFSPLSSGTTGETIYVDAGYSIMGMAMD